MTTSQDFESYIPVYDSVPEKWEDARPFIVEQLRKVSNGLNIREIGWFLDEQLLSGKQFIPGINLTGTTEQFRSVFRKVVDFGPLPNAGTKSVPHGIVFDANFTLIQLWAAATDPINLFAAPIPFASVTLANTVQIYMDAVNINITTSVNQSAYTRCFVFIEFIQEL